MEKWELEMIKDLLRRQAEEWRRFVEESEADADAYPELSKIAAQLDEPAAKGYKWECVAKFDNGDVVYRGTFPHEPYPTCPVCIVDAANSIICKK